MMTSVSRAMLTLAMACMGEKHRAWGLAMRAELEEAIDAGKPLRFAFGCLAVSLMRMPTHAEGRFSLTTHALALGLMIPMAALQIGCAVIGSPYFPTGSGAAAVSAFQMTLLTSAYQALMPLLAVLLLLLGVGQLRMAWTLLDRDWPRVMATGALTLATTMAIVTLRGLLYLDLGHTLVQGVILAIELAVLAGLGQWHAELPPIACADHPTG